MSETDASPRTAELSRKTFETDISLSLCLDGNGQATIDTGSAFFDHMLTLMTAHGQLDLALTCRGDLAVDLHHSVEDVGLVLGAAIARALGDRSGIRRYADLRLPMDEALAMVALDLSNRPYLVYRVPVTPGPDLHFGPGLAREFFRAVAVKSGMTLHIELAYGENEHHIVEAIFKAFGRALRQAVARDKRVTGIPSTKGAL